MILPEYIKTEEDYQEFIENLKWFNLSNLTENNQPLRNNCNFILQGLANDAFDKGIITNNVPYIMDPQDNNILRVIKPTDSYTKRDTIEADIAEMNYEEK